MKTFLKNYPKWGLMTCLCLIIIGFIAVAGHGPQAAALAFLPFAIGAIKVRDDMTVVRIVKYTHTSATVKDTVYLLNGVPMLALNSADANVSNLFVIAGLIEYAKTSAQAWTGGVKLYWDDTAKVFTTASSGNTLAGFASEAAANPSSTGFVILMPMLIGTNGLENLIADPGTGVAIPVTTSGICAITTGASGQTNTLAIPTRIGQELILCLDVDGGGDRVITVASAINQTGNNTITLNDAGDTVHLVAVQKAGALVWRVVVNDGASLTTV